VVVIAGMRPLEHLTPLGATGNLADAAHSRLSELILRNALLPGTPLSVPELSRRLEISRSPVREAVQRLVYDGLADYRGRSGTFVSSIDTNDFLDLLEVREVLEGLAARMAATRATDREIGKFAEIHDRLGRSEPTTQLVELDMAFHRLIRQMARNPEISRPLARAQARAHLSMHSLWTGERNVESVRHEHAGIVAAIRARDPDRADQTARDHIAELRSRVLQESRDGTD
jgi:DNA-binding GntR family transcriptional regulator